MINYISIIEQALKLKNMTAAKASMLAVGNPSAIKNMKNGKIPTLDNFHKICNILGIDFIIGLPPSLPTPDHEVGFYGKIAAGGGDMPSDGHIIGNISDQLDTISAPPFLNAESINKWGGLASFIVSGQSMAPHYNDGDTIYIYMNDPLKNDADKLLGKDCAVVLTEKHDHAIYLKRLRRADKTIRGLYNLESINLEWKMMENIPIQNAYPIRFLTKNI